MKQKLRLILKFVFFFLLLMLSFSYAMFQGGFVSWFLFYGVAVLFLLSLSVFFVPFRALKFEREFVNKETLYGGDDLEVEIVRNGRFLHPFCYVKAVDLVPPPLKRHLPNGSGALFFFSWQKKQSFRYKLANVPRGTHEFGGIQVEIGDLFGFFERQKTFSLPQELLVYPKYRRLEDWQVHPSGEEEKTFSFGQAIETDLNISGVRHYVQGDKLSLVDWKRTAKHSELMSKQFSELEENAGVLLFNPYVERTSKETFERQVELAASFIHDFYAKQRPLAFVILNKDAEYVEKTAEFSQYREMYRLLANVRYIHQTFLPPAQGLPLASVPYWIVLTSSLADSFVHWLLKQKKYVQTIVVCWFCEAPSEEEKKNRLLLREHHVRVYTFMKEARLT